MGWPVKTALWGAVILVAALVGWPLIQEIIAEQSSSTSSTEAPGQTPGVAQPCPAEAAAWLPGQTGTLVARYQTTKHLITVCQATDGQFFYDGQIMGQPEGPDTHISLPAQASGDGYVAYNGAYTYQLTGGRIVVTNDGTVVLDELLQPA
jgi:hypothetical protein